MLPAKSTKQKQRNERTPVISLWNQNKNSEMNEHQWYHYEPNSKMNGHQWYHYETKTRTAKWTDTSDITMKPKQKQRNERTPVISLWTKTRTAKWTETSDITMNQNKNSEMNRHQWCHYEPKQVNKASCPT